MILLFTEFSEFIENLNRKNSNSVPVKISDWHVKSKNYVMESVNTQFPKGIPLY